MAALPTAIFPSNLDNNDTNNDKVLRQLQKISSELGRLRSDVTAIRTAQPPTQEPQQQAITKEINLEDLLEVGTTKPFRHQVATASEHNKLARSYNSVLLNHQDFIAPLRNYRNKPVFGFPETLGALVSLDSAAEKLLCGAFGIPYVMNEYSFAIFCGFCPQLLDSISRHAPTGGDIALIRMLTRNKRARDVFLVDPTPQTRRAAAYG